MFTQSEITKRVLGVFDYFKANGMVGSQHEFCQKIGFHTVSFAQVKRGKRDFPDSLLPELCKVYNISMDYLEKGEGEMFSGGRPPVKPIKEIKGANKADGIKRIWTKDLNVAESEDGVIISYTDVEGKKKIVEFIRK